MGQSHLIKDILVTNKWHRSGMNNRMGLINSAGPDLPGNGGVVSIAHLGGVIFSLVAEVYTAYEGVIVYAVAMVFLFARYEGN